MPIRWVPSNNSKYYTKYMCFSITCVMWHWQCHLCYICIIESRHTKLYQLTLKNVSRCLQLRSNIKFTRIYYPNYYCDIHVIFVQSLVSLISILLGTIISAIFYFIKAISKTVLFHQINFMRKINITRLWRYE